MEIEKEKTDGKKPKEEVTPNKPEDPIKDKDAGTPTKEKTIVDEAREERKLMEEERKKVKEENDRTEKLASERELGGKSSMSKAPAKKEDTPEEYAEKLDRGEVNPLKEDGYI